MSKKVLKVQKENCDLLIPTKWNIYEWAKEHPDTTIAHAMKRIEKSFDFSDAIQCGFSGGKDSTLSANLAAFELNLRKLRVKHGIDRHGNKRIDPLDAKWANKRLHMAMTDAEIVFSFTNDYSKRFLATYGPEGHDLIEFNWICLPLSWQSGVSFDSGLLTSWDKDKKDIWVQEMHSKESLHGFEALNEDNLASANPVALSSLKPAAQKFHIENDHVIKARECDLFGSKSDSKEYVDAVGNFGRGPIKFFVHGMHEKDEQDGYSLWMAETTWLVANDVTNEVKEAIMAEHDISKDVWFIKPAEKGYTTSAFISLRAEESLDRRVILSQGEYSTGQYSNNNGVNIISPVFDLTTADVWRLLSATDWDVNDVYDKLYQVGVGIGDQRVGSLLNYAAVRSISTVKALEPDLYARINARFSNVEFMSQFSKAGYYKIGKPKDTPWDGQNHVKAGYYPEEVLALSDKYEKLLKQLEIPYTRDENVFRSAIEKQKMRPWFPLKGIDELDERLDVEGLALLKELAIIHTTWRDYTLMLLNSTPDPIRSIWQEKVVTSFGHWNFGSGSISEGNLAGLEFMSAIPGHITKAAVDDEYPVGTWKKLSRLAGSKRMKVEIGNYPQEALSNQANLVAKYLIGNWDLYSNLFGEIPILKKIWDFAQMSGGNCIIPDEVLTYILEREVDDSVEANWVDVAIDLYTNGIPSETYAEYYKVEKMEDFPLPVPPSLEEQKQNFLDVCDIFFKEDIAYSPAWKKIAICILKNDVSMKYAGFSQTLREREAREMAVDAFDTQKKAEKKAKKEALKMAEDLAKQAEEAKLAEAGA